MGVLIRIFLVCVCVGGGGETKETLMKLRVFFTPPTEMRPSEFVQKP